MKLGTVRDAKRFNPLTIYAIALATIFGSGLVLLAAGDQWQAKVLAFLRSLGL